MKTQKQKRWGWFGLVGIWIAVWLMGSSGWTAESRPDWEITLVPNASSGVALVGEVVEYRVTVNNRTEPKRTVELAVEIQAPGEKARRERWSLSFEGPGKQEKTLTLPTVTRGYWSLLATVSESGKDLAKRQSALAVVEKPRNYGQVDKGSFFGSMFNRDPEAGQRIGIKYERQMTVWNWLSPVENAYSWEKLDARVELLSRHGVSIVLVILMEKPPKWAKWSSLEDLAKPEFLPYFQKFTKDVVERYRGRIAAIEVLNEPDLECARGLRGNIPPFRIYATLLKAAYQTVKSVAPELPVIGLDVSGEDFPHLRFAGEVMAEDHASIDIMGGHPYASTRYLGGGAQAESPDKINTVGRLTGMADLMKTHGLKPRVWPTEFGWGLYKDELMSSPATELWAAYAGQAIGMARSVPEVEKLFWFSMSFPGYEGGFTYGMFQGDPDNYYPTPAAAVYATCARFLDDVRFVRRLALGEFGKVLRFVDNRTGDGVFMLWLSEPKAVGGEVQLASPAKSFEGLEINDGYGRVVTGDPAIRAMPLFIRTRGGDADRLEQFIQSTPLRAKETLLIERTYLSDASHLHMDVANNSGGPTSVKLFAKNNPGLAQSRRLVAGSSVVSLSLSEPLVGRGDIALELMEESSGKRHPVTFSYDLAPVVKLSQVKIDGRLDEVIGLKSHVRDNRDAVYPRDPGVDWNGPKDLSMEVWTGWTDEGLYLAVKVTDDVATESSEGDSLFWQKDSLQIAWDMGNRAESGYDKQCLELGVFRTTSDTAAYQLYPNAKALSQKEIATSSRREEGITSYEILIPWGWLDAAGVARGRVFRMNLIANDNDGRRRKCWIGLTPGIGEGKHPSAFRQWVLEERSASSSSNQKTSEPSR